MKILITGASGGIGKKLLDEVASSKKYDLYILSRKPNPLKKRLLNVQIRIGDILNYDSLKKALQEIDAVVHLAGLTHTHKEEDYYRINLDGTVNLLKAADANQVQKFIFISSRAASMEGGAYAKSKYLAQERVATYAYNWIILSPSEVYGTGSENEAISNIINHVQKYPVIPIPGNGTYRLCPVFIEDVVDAIIKALETPLSNKNYVLAGPEAYTYKDFVDIVAKMNGKKIIKIYIPLYLIRIAAVLFRKRLTKDQIPRLTINKPEDINLAREELCFRPRPLSEGLKMY